MALAECLERKTARGRSVALVPVNGSLQRTLAALLGRMRQRTTSKLYRTDPMSSFNRRAGFRESAKLAWAHEDSHTKVRAAVLRKGGSPEEEFRPGDMVSLKTGGWIGPASWHVKGRTSGCCTLGYRSWLARIEFEEPMLRSISKSSF